MNSFAAVIRRLLNVLLMVAFLFLPIATNATVLCICTDGHIAAGAVQAARQRVRAAEVRARQTEREVEQEQAALLRSIELLYLELEELDERMLPAATAAYRQPLDAMQRGRLGFLNLQEMSEQLLRYQRRRARLGEEITRTSAELYLINGIYPVTEGNKSCEPE